MICSLSFFKNLFISKIKAQQMIYARIKKNWSPWLPQPPAIKQLCLLCLWTLWILKWKMFFYLYVVIFYVQSAFHWYIVVFSSDRVFNDRRDLQLSICITISPKFTKDFYKGAVLKVYRFLGTLGIGFDCHTG